MNATVTVTVDGVGGTVEFRILGPLQIHDDQGQLCALGSVQTRLLAVLLLTPNHTVTWHRLVDAVWGEHPPATAKRQIQNVVSALRRQWKGTDPSRQILIGDHTGYRICVQEGQLDAEAFHTQVTAAHTAISNGQTTEAAQRLRDALTLWRGPALAGCTSPVIEAAAHRLDEQHLATLEWCMDLELELGRHHDLIGELTELVATHPLRERLVGLLMRALHGCGRQADALTVFQQLRARLGDDLGIDPSSDIQQLHTAILRNQVEPTPTHTTPPLSASRTAEVVLPRQLPAAVAHFAGRAEELAALTGLLDAESGATVVISAIGGTAGVGKTALAVHWAHRVADRFPDGQLHVDLRGLSPDGSVVTPAEAVRRFLDALDVPPQRIPADPQAQVALYRSQLAGRRMLLVLDNARDSAQVRPLLPGARGCLVLVTSRNQLSGLVAADGAHPINLDVLSVGEARELLTRRLGASRVAAEPDAVAEIIARCARLPLALALIAARAATRPRVALRILAGELADIGQRWQTLTGDDPHTDVRAVFSWSYHALTPAAARLFRLLGLHPGPDLAAPAAASLAGLTPDAIRPLLAELTRASLLAEPIPGRYTFHDLLRDYTVHLADTIDTDAQRHTATGRILDHYLHTAYPAERLLHPGRDPLPLTPPQTGGTPEQLNDHEQAWGWFTAEHQVLLAAVTHAEATGFHTHTWQLAWTLANFLDRRGHWHDHVAVGQVAVAAAQRLADPAAQARSHRNLAIAYTRLGRLDDARTQLHHALDLATQTGDQTQQANTHQSLAVLWQRRGQPAQALHHARQALHLYQATGQQAGQASALNAVGWYHTLLGEHQQAIIYCQQALTLYQQLGNRGGQANTWDSLGHAHHGLGQHTRAVTCYQHALTQYRDLGDRYNEADTLSRLGDTHHTTGNAQAARDAWQQAFAILDDLDHPDAAQVCAKLADLDSSPDQAGQ